MRLVDNQWNHELWHDSGQDKIPVALRDSYFDEFALRSFRSQLTDLADSVVLARFPAQLGFWHGFGMVDVRDPCIARGSGLESDK